MNIWPHSSQRSSPVKGSHDFYLIKFDLTLYLIWSNSTLILPRVETGRRPQTVNFSTVFNKGTVFKYTWRVQYMKSCTCTCTWVHVLCKNYTERVYSKENVDINTAYVCMWWKSVRVTGSKVTGSHTWCLCIIIMIVRWVDENRVNATQKSNGSSQSHHIFQKEINFMSLCHWVLNMIIVQTKTQWRLGFMGLTDFVGSIITHVRYYIHTLSWTWQKIEFSTDLHVVTSTHQK